MANPVLAILIGPLMANRFLPNLFLGPRRGRGDPEKWGSERCGALKGGVQHFALFSHSNNNFLSFFSLGVLSLNFGWFFLMVLGFLEFEVSVRVQGFGFWGARVEGLGFRF